MDTSNGDIFIWKRVKNGDISAFEHLYDSYSALLFSFAHQYSSDEDLIQDAIHDTFLDIYKYKDNLADNVNIKPYLFKSLQRNIFKKLKASNKLISIEQSQWYDVNESSAEELLIENESQTELNIKLAFALEELPKKQRKALFLRFNEECTYEEIALQMNISLESCRTLVYRALKELRNKFKKKGYFFVYVFDLLVLLRYKDNKKITFCISILKILLHENGRN